MLNLPGRWEFYDTFIEEAPASIFVNIDASDPMPDPARPILLATMIRLEDPTEHGLATPGELEWIVENGLFRPDEVARQLKARFVGHFVSQGSLDAFYYVGEAQSQRVADVLSSVWPDVNHMFEFSIEPDPDWEHYRNILYPSPIEFRMILNREKMEDYRHSHLGHLTDPENLRANAELSSLNVEQVEAINRVAADHVEYVLQFQRETIVHLIYFPTEEARRMFALQVQGEGFNITDSPPLDPSMAPTPFGLKVEREETMVPHEIDNAVLSLWIRAEESGSRYIDWHVQGDEYDEDGEYDEDELEDFDEAIESQGESSTSHEYAFDEWTKRHGDALRSRQFEDARNLLGEWPTERVGESLRLSIGDESWARTHFRLGVAHTRTPAPEEDALLTKAIWHFESALTIYEQTKHPMLWAMTQGNMGIAYSQLRGGDPLLSGRAAIRCFRAALRIYTEVDHPQEWAMTQREMAGVYSKLPSTDANDNLRRAIKCLRSALRVLNLEDSPSEWGQSYLDLGNSYRFLSAGDRSENLTRAISSFKKSLRAYTKMESPRWWSFIQSNIGHCYRDLPAGDRTENLLSAITRYELALGVRTEEETPYEWGSTQLNLGVAHHALASGDREENLKTAIGHYGEALRIWSKVGSRAGDLGLAHLNLGLAYRDLNKTVGDVDTVSKAREHLGAAAREYEVAGSHGDARRAYAALSSINDSSINLRGMKSDKVKTFEALYTNLEGWNDFRAANPGYIPDLSWDANLEGRSFRQALLMGANLSQANLRGAQFDSCRMPQSDLSDADLGCANFRGAILIKANLTRAKLHGTDLRWAKLKKAVMRGADLTNADLSQTDLSDVDLSETILTGACLAGAIYDERTTWPVGFDPATTNRTQSPPS